MLAEEIRIKMSVGFFPSALHYLSSHSMILNSLEILALICKIWNEIQLHNYD